MKEHSEIPLEQNGEAESLSELSSQSLLFLSIASTAVYFLIALLIFYFLHDDSLITAFKHGFSVPIQLVTGLGVGALAALLIIWSAGRPPVSDVLHDFYLVREISGTKFSTFDRIQLSFFAGTGEELLFRGAVQPLLGIWITSAIFVAIHGYFKFRKVGHWIFGALMFGLSMLLGLLFEHAGLIAAMTTHAVYDMLMLWWVQVKRADTK